MKKPIENGYYYIRIVGDRNYTNTPEYMDNNWTLKDGTVVISPLANIDNSNIIKAEVSNPSAPCSAFTMSLWLNTGEDEPFKILKKVPSHEEASEMQDRIEELERDEFDRSMYSERDTAAELIEWICEQVNTFGHDPVELLREKCREHNLLMTA